MVFQDKRVVIFGLPVSYFFNFVCTFFQLGIIHFLIILLWKSMYPSDGEHYKEFLYKQRIHKWWLTSLFLFLGLACLISWVLDFILKFEAQHSANVWFDNHWNLLFLLGINVIPNILGLRLGCYCCCCIWWDRNDEVSWCGI